MKKALTILTILCTLSFTPILSASEAMNCESEITCCDPCDPSAPVCGTSCGISMCAVTIGVAAVVAAGAIILLSGDGASSSHG